MTPRLKANAVVSGETGSRDWRYVRFTPGGAGSPLEALFTGLCDAFPEHAVSPFMIAQEKKAFLDSLAADPKTIVAICLALLNEAKAPAWAEVLLFVDQFEELFTLVPETERAAFIAVLEAAADSNRMRVVITMRSDFLPVAIEYPALAALLNLGNYMLAAPTAGALVEMIKRPAERAGLIWDAGLPERIQADTGSDAGALALMAYALDELYEAAKQDGDGRLTHDAYERIGRVSGAIGRRAESVFAELDLPDKEKLLESVFRELVSVDDRGTATRQRAALQQCGEAERTLIRALADARLLVTDQDSAEVAHEAVFRCWNRLRLWILESQEDLILLRQVRAAAAEWDAKNRPDYLLWRAERLKLVYAMIERQQSNLSEIEKSFIEPEQERLLREIADIATGHPRRRVIGERLAMIGDTRTGIGIDQNGIPQIDWLPIESSGQIEIEGQIFTVEPFYVAQYLVTHRQFQAFLDADDGFRNAAWWKDFPKAYVRQEMESAVAQYGNYPRDTVSWYQAIAFTRWLDVKYRKNGLFAGLPALTPNPSPTGEGVDWQIRLPTEWEWQWMAQNGDEARQFPWGEWDEYPRANTTEAGIGNRSTAVGMYPDGATNCGAFDVAGNLWEWCLNDYGHPEVINGYNNGQTKVLRGGSFYFNRGGAACAYRLNFDPFFWGSSYGFRVVVGRPIP